MGRPYRIVEVSENGKKEDILEVGISNVPFDTDDVDDEGLDLIIGVDFVQKVDLHV